MKRDKINVILADCDKEEVKTLQDGLNDGKKWNFTTESCISNGSHRGGYNLLRYLKYFTFPWHILLHRGKYNVIIGWQQFYAINFAFFSHLFHVKKINPLIAFNFTYKQKEGVVGKIYKRYMSYALHGEYIDYLHVPSNNYAQSCSKDLNIPIEKFLVTTFGVPDQYDDWKDSKVSINGYTLSIGRSNRDFDFLVKVWSRPELSKHKLVLISDTYKPSIPIPENVQLFNNITGEASKPWIANCNMMIIPIDDGSICSGDTVLLTGMLFKKCVVVTAPSTLSEMYIQKGVDGITLEKDTETFTKRIAYLLDAKDERKKIGENARKTYLARFSRFQLGKQVQTYVEKII